MPRLFGTALYLANRDGLAEQELASLLDLPEDWVHERIEAARLCLEKQVQLVRH